MEQRAVPALELANLTLGYGGAPALVGVSAVVPHGAQVAVVGPNGAGKTTLIKAVAGLLPALGGRLLVCGRPLGKDRERIAYVPQRAEIDWRFPVTVLDVVLMGRYGHLGLFRRPGRQDLRVAISCLERLAIDDLAHRPIDELSGGQQQRVFLARALAQDPHILLLDEPFAGVDAPTQEAALNLLDSLHNVGITVVVSTHDLALASSRFDLLMLLNKRLIAFGPPAQALSKDALSQTFSGHVLFYRSGDEVVVVTDECCSQGRDRVATGQGIKRAV